MPAIYSTFKNCNKKTVLVTVLVFALCARNSECIFLVESEMFETETIVKICYFMEKN